MEPGGMHRFCGMFGPAHEWANAQTNGQALCSIYYYFIDPACSQVGQFERLKSNLLAACRQEVAPLAERRRVGERVDRAGLLDAARRADERAPSHAFQRRAERH